MSHYLTSVFIKVFRHDGQHMFDRQQKFYILPRAGEYIETPHGRIRVTKVIHPVKPELMIYIHAETL